MASKKVFRWAAPLCAAAAALTLGAVAAPRQRYRDRDADRDCRRASGGVSSLSRAPLRGDRHLAQRRLGGRPHQRGNARAALERQQVEPSTPSRPRTATSTASPQPRPRTSGRSAAPTGSPRPRPSPTAGTAARGPGCSTPTRPAAATSTPSRRRRRPTPGRSAWPGQDRGSSGSTTPLIEHWNGKRWTEQGVKPIPGGGLFSGVAATSADNAWAVGQTGSADQQTVIEHWNGKAWARVPSPNVTGATGSTLKSVTAISSDNAWAVGSATKPGSAEALTMHWDGRQWTIVPGNTPDGDAALLGVLATWTHNIWAVGIIHPSACSNGGPKCQTLIEHWNSKRWKVLPSPNPPSGYLNLLWAASATSRDNIWAVGTTDYGSTLIVHWNGAAWS